MSFQAGYAIHTGHSAMPRPGWNVDAVARLKLDHAIAFIRDGEPDTPFDAIDYLMIIMAVYHVSIAAGIRPPFRLQALRLHQMAQLCFGRDVILWPGGVFDVTHVPLDLLEYRD